MKTPKLFILFTLLLFTQCNFEERQQQTEQPEQKDQIQIIYANWTEGIAITNLIKIILTEHLGYEVITKMDNIEHVYAGIASGEYDFFPDAWLPHTHAQYWQEYKDSIQDLGVIFNKARTGIVVPAYMEIDSIAEINQLKPDIIRITGIDSLAGIMNSTRQAIENYNLQAIIQEGREKTMIDSLEQNYLKRKNYLFTGWEPHWIFSRYDLKFLADPDTVFGGSEQIHILGKIGLENEYPNLSLFLGRINLTDNQMNSLLNEIKAYEGYPERGARNWIDKNKSTVNKWIHGFRVKRRYSR